MTISLDEISDAEIELDGLQSKYLSQHGWHLKYVKQLRLWCRDFVDVDERQLANPKTTNYQSIGILTVPQSIATMLTAEYLDKEMSDG